MYRVPRATYRVQLNSGFTFADANAIVPYLAELGVSDLYTSPILKARKGSTHGYDIVDPTVGFVISGRPGQKVAKGEPLASIYARDADGLAIARAALKQAVEIGEGKADVMPLIAARVTGKGVEQLS